jgi:hypothetical protein
MARLLRPAGAAAVAALLMAGAATASTLQVKSAKGAFTIATHQDAGVYRTTVVVPTEYMLRAGRPVRGTAVVTTAAKTLRGSLQSVAPARYNDDECAANVGYDHVAVWLVRAAGVQLPVYVDAGPEGTTLLTWCANAATKLAVTGVTISINRGFDLPAVHGAFTWQALFDSGKTQRATSSVTD